MLLKLLDKDSFTFSKGKQVHKEHSLISLDHIYRMLRVNLMC